MVMNLWYMNMDSQVHHHGYPNDPTQYRELRLLEGGINLETVISTQCRSYGLKTQVWCLCNFVPQLAARVALLPGLSQRNKSMTTKNLSTVLRDNKQAMWQQRELYSCFSCQLEQRIVNTLACDLRIWTLLVHTTSDSGLPLSTIFDHTCFHIPHKQVCVIYKIIHNVSVSIN